MMTPRTFQSRQCSLQWRESFRMMGLVSRRLSVVALALTMVLPPAFRARANIRWAHGVAADCCGANCPPPATHGATGPKCCAFSRLPFSSSRTTCETNSSRDSVWIARASWLSQFFSKPIARTKSYARLSPTPLPLDRLCSLQL